MAYNSAYTGPQVDAAVGAVQGKETTWDGKQDKLTGRSGQVVGFDAEGNAIAQTPPETGDVKADGSVPMTGDLNMGGHRITNVSAPTQPTDAVRQSDLKTVSDEVDGIISGATPIILPPATITKIGGVIVGDGIDVEANGTISVTPGLTQEQADERYLQLTGGELNDDAIFQLPGDNGSLYLGGRNNVPNVGMYASSSGYITLHDNTMGNVNIRGVRSPESDYDAANKFYVDTQLSTKLTTPTGTAGQLLGFTADNTVGAVDAPESGLTQEQADARYLQLNSDAMITGDITFKYGADFDGSKITSVGTPANGSDGANKAYVDSKAPLPPVPVTLTTSGWSSNTQTVTVSGVVASETAQLITPTPAIASQSAYYEAGIMCTNQGTNSLTFTCQTVPTSNLTVYVVIQPLG